MRHNPEILVPTEDFNSDELSINDVQQLLDDLEEADPMLAGVVIHTEDDVEPPDGFRPLEHALAEQLTQLENEFENERKRWRRLSERIHGEF